MSGEKKMNLISERGKLLFKESGIKRYDRNMFIVGGILFLWCIVLFWVGAFDSYFHNRIGRDVVPWLFLILVTIVFIFIVYQSLYVTICRMPFIIYENGLTLIHVPFSNGVKKKDIFLTWPRIRDIQIQESKGRIIPEPIKKMIIKYDNDIKETITTKDIKYLEFNTAFQLISKYIPNK